MKIYHNNEQINITESTAVAIGKFDGEHIGHRKLIEVLKDTAKRMNISTAIFTFSSPVNENDISYKGQISTYDERNDKLAYSGIDYIVEYPFNHDIATIEAEDFVKDILVKSMHMKAIVAGPDCSFGYQRRGNVDMLVKLGKIYGFETIIIDKEKDDGIDISSTYIKELLSQGNIDKVTKLLDMPYAISGNVTRGNGYGKSKFHYPTVNIYPRKDKYLPRRGVYLTYIYIEDKKYYGMTNVGINPTVSDDHLHHIARIETHIFDFNEDIYDKNIKIEFIKFIRDEMKFDNPSALKKQLDKDYDTCMRLCHDEH